MPDKINLEIEFKCQINALEYEKLLKKYNIDISSIKEQTNYYFDTKNLLLTNNNVMVRIRQKGLQYKITLKQKDEDDNNIERHYYLKHTEAINYLNDGMPGHYANISDTIYNIASLKTYRVSFEYKGGKLFFDKSIYSNITDYEIEYEVENKDEGFKIFNEFLEENNIIFRKSESKVKRCFKAANIIK